MSYKDPDKQREFNRKWMQQRRKDFFVNKKCSRCGAKRQLILTGMTKLGLHGIWSRTPHNQEKLAKKGKILCYKCRHHSRFFPGQTREKIEKAKEEIARRGLRF